MNQRIYFWLSVPVMLLLGGLLMIGGIFTTIGESYGEIIKTIKDMNEESKQ